MKKIYIIALVIVAAAFILIISGRHSPFGKKNTSFASKPNEEITKIVFSNKGKELTLGNSDGRWLLNGKLETRRNSISYIISVLKNLDIKSPVSPEQFDTAIIKKNIEPVRVRTYENNKLLNDILVYKTRSNIYGNIMKTGKRNKPFIVFVPGLDADIGSAFTLNELYWQPYTIFNLLPSEIISVDLKNFSDSSESFSILKNGSGYSLTAGEIPLIGFDTSLVKRYLTYFTFIPFETWAIIDGSAGVQIPVGPQLYSIKVKTQNSELDLSLWERTNPDGTTDSDRVYGKTNSADAIFIARYFDIDPILKRREYFFAQE